MVDKLDFLFDMQKKLQIEIAKKNIDFSILTHQEIINLMFIGIIEEAVECIKETPWKPWKKSVILDKEKLQDEIIDLWHFVINLSLLADLNSNIIFNKYIKKHNINLKRQLNGY